MRRNGVTTERSGGKEKKRTRRRRAALRKLYASGLGADTVSLLPVQKGNDGAAVEQDRLHFPKPRRCLLFEPRSDIPDENFPRPIMPRFFFRR
jgi:hypothetical protein